MPEVARSRVYDGTQRYSWETQPWLRLYSQKEARIVPTVLNSCPLDSAPAHLHRKWHGWIGSRWLLFLPTCLAPAHLQRKQHGCFGSSQPQFLPTHLAPAHLQRRQHIWFPPAAVPAHTLQLLPTSIFARINPEAAWNPTSLPARCCARLWTGNYRTAAVL